MMDIPGEETLMLIVEPIFNRNLVHIIFEKSPSLQSGPKSVSDFGGTILLTKESTGAYVAERPEFCPPDMHLYIDELDTELRKTQPSHICRGTIYPQQKQPKSSDTLDTATKISSDSLGITATMLTLYTLSITTISFIHLSTDSLVGEYCSGYLHKPIEDRGYPFCLVICYVPTEPSVVGSVLLICTSTKPIVEPQKVNMRFMEIIGLINRTLFLLITRR
ncbi:hypothetical protein TNCV_2363321 [Trichonephila clavipes]|nr:hypothetical protein TNCV_2363321 [Trichonephila clavipes]